MGRNAAGKDGKERLSGSVLEQIPFLQNCEDEDSDEDDDLDSVQHKKQRVKVRFPPLPPPGGHLLCGSAANSGSPMGALGAPFVAWFVCGLTLSFPRVLIPTPAKPCLSTVSPTLLLSSSIFPSAFTFFLERPELQTGPAMHCPLTALSLGLASSWSHRDIFGMVVALCLLLQ